jgi:hypothetical protein
MFLSPFKSRSKCALHLGQRQFLLALFGGPRKKNYLYEPFYIGSPSSSYSEMICSWHGRTPCRDSSAQDFAFASVVQEALAGGGLRALSLLHVEI